jgi:putative acetyltransferase
MKFVVREARDGDYAAIGQLFFETIHSVNLRDYTPEQVAAWAPAALSGDEWRTRLAGQVVLVAVEGAMVAGFVSIEKNGHIDFLFVHKDRQRQGVGSALLGRVIELAVQWKVASVYTEASITARGLFERHGFEVVEAEDVVRHGVTLRRYRMLRRL